MSLNKESSATIAITILFGLYPDKVFPFGLIFLHAVLQQSFGYTVHQFEGLNQQDDTKEDSSDPFVHDTGFRYFLGQFMPFNVYINPFKCVFGVSEFT